MFDVLRMLADHLIIDTVVRSFVRHTFQSLMFLKALCVGSSCLCTFRQAPQICYDNRRIAPIIHPQLLSLEQILVVSGRTTL